MALWTRGVTLALLVGPLVAGAAFGDSSPTERAASHPTIVEEERPDSPSALLGASSGVASYYGGHFDGRRTASGVRFDQLALTAAHRTLPFGTLLEVTNLANLRKVIVKVTDRGPFAPGRVIDLSRGAARKLGMVSAGLARVRLKVIEP